MIHIFVKRPFEGLKSEKCVFVSLKIQYFLNHRCYTLSIVVPAVFPSLRRLPCMCGLGPGSIYGIFVGGLLVQIWSHPIVGYFLGYDFLENQCPLTKWNTSFKRSSTVSTKKPQRHGHSLKIQYRRFENVIKLALWPTYLFHFNKTLGR